MDLVLSGFQGVELYVYLDDIIVFASDLEEHGKQFRRLMKRLDEANPTIEPSKCQFLQREASFLGHIAENGQIRPDLKKIEAVRDFLTPINKRKVKQFYGLASYYRRFVKNFAEIAYPLSQLTRGKDGKNPRPFTWGRRNRSLSIN